MKVRFAMAFGLIAFMALAIELLAQGKQHATAPSDLMKVYVDVQGDAKLVKRFSTYVDFEMEDAGMVRVEKAADAEAVLKAELRMDVQQTHIGVGIVHVQMTENGQQTKADMCATLNSDPNGDLFNRAAQNISEVIHGRKPDARRIRIEPEGDTKASADFANELPTELRNVGYQIVNSADADLLVRIDLSRETVALREAVTQYVISTSGRSGEGQNTTKGTAVNRVELLDPPPATCPKQFERFDWLSGGNSLTKLAADAVNQLSKRSIKRQAH